MLYYFRHFQIKSIDNNTTIVVFHSFLLSLIARPYTLEDISPDASFPDADMKAQCRGKAWYLDRRFFRSC
jgi:hypothetical protein